MQASDSERIAKLVSDTVSMLCKNSVPYCSDLKIRGLIGVTSDSTNVYLIEISETFGSGSNAETSSSVASEAQHVPVRRRLAMPMAPPPRKMLALMGPAASDGLMQNQPAAGSVGKQMAYTQSSPMKPVVTPSKNQQAVMKLQPRAAVLALPAPGNATTKANLAAQRRITPARYQGPNASYRHRLPGPAGRGQMIRKPMNVNMPGRQIRTAGLRQGLAAMRSRLKGVSVPRGAGMRAVRPVQQMRRGVGNRNNPGVGRGRMPAPVTLQTMGLTVAVPPTKSVGFQNNPRLLSPASTQRAAQSGPRMQSPSSNPRPMQNVPRVLATGSNQRQISNVPRVMSPASNQRPMQGAPRVLSPNANQRLMMIANRPVIKTETPDSHGPTPGTPSQMQPISPRVVGQMSPGLLLPRYNQASNSAPQTPRFVQQPVSFPSPRVNVPPQSPNTVAHRLDMQSRMAVAGTVTPLRSPHAPSAPQSVGLPPRIAQPRLMLTAAPASGSQPSEFNKASQSPQQVRPILQSLVGSPAASNLTMMPSPLQIRGIANTGNQIISQNTNNPSLLINPALQTCQPSDMQVKLIGVLSQENMQMLSVGKVHDNSVFVTHPAVTQVGCNAASANAQSGTVVHAQHVGSMQGPCAGNSNANLATAAVLKLKQEPCVGSAPMQLEPTKRGDVSAGTLPMSSGGGTPGITVPMRIISEQGLKAVGFPMSPNQNPMIRSSAGPNMASRLQVPMSQQIQDSLPLTQSVQIRPPRLRLNFSPSGGVTGPLSPLRVGESVKVEDARSREMTHNQSTGLYQSGSNVPSGKSQLELAVLNSMSEMTRPVGLSNLPTGFQNLSTLRNESQSELNLRTQTTVVQQMPQLAADSPRSVKSQERPEIMTQNQQNLPSIHQLPQNPPSAMQSQPNLDFPGQNQQRLQSAILRLQSPASLSQNQWNLPSVFSNQQLVRSGQTTQQAILSQPQLQRPQWNETSVPASTPTQLNVHLNTQNLVGSQSSTPVKPFGLEHNEKPTPCTTGTLSRGNNSTFATPSTSYGQVFSQFVVRQSLMSSSTTPTFGQVHWAHQSPHHVASSSSSFTTSVVSGTAASPASHPRVFDRQPVRTGNVQQAAALASGEQVMTPSSPATRQTLASNMSPQMPVLQQQLSVQSKILETGNINQPRDMDQKNFHMQQQKHIFGSSSAAQQILVNQMLPIPGPSKPCSSQSSAVEESDGGQSRTLKNWIQDMLGSNLPHSQSVSSESRLPDFASQLGATAREAVRESGSANSFAVTSSSDVDVERNVAQEVVPIMQSDAYEHRSHSQSLDHEGSKARGLDFDLDAFAFSQVQKVVEMRQREKTLPASTETLASVSKKKPVTEDHNSGNNPDLFIGLLQETLREEESKKSKCGKLKNPKGGAKLLACNLPGSEMEEENSVSPSSTIPYSEPESPLRLDDSDFDDLEENLAKLAEPFMSFDEGSTARFPCRVGCRFAGDNECELASHYTDTHTQDINLEPAENDQHYAPLLTSTQSSARSDQPLDFPCPFPQCGRAFSKVSGVCNHHLKAHKTVLTKKQKTALLLKYGQLHRCQVCPRGFANKTDLLHHMAKTRHGK